ncbi:MAG: SDR family NAD(P)-dependent oxidoreductase [bacterium]
MKKILITGGAGFIGAHLAKKLAKMNYNITIIDKLSGNNAALKQERLNKFLDNREYTFYNLDLFDFNRIKKVFKRHRFDIICHFAAKTNLIFDPEYYEKNNIIGTLNIFELAKEFKTAKIIFASSSMVYGNNDKLPFCESDNTDCPLSLYAATKKSNEILAYTYHRLHGIQMVGLRFFTTYGPWGRLDMSIRKFTEQILRNEEIEMYNFGKIERDFNYIDDTINGIIAAIEKSFNYELFNIGSGKTASLEKIINLIEENLKIKARKKYIPMQPGDMPKTWADIRKAKKLLNYKPQISIEEGIKRFIVWNNEYNSKL